MIKRNPSAKSIDRVEYREGIRFENDYLLDELVVVVAAGGTCGKKKERRKKGKNNAIVKRTRDGTKTSSKRIFRFLPRGKRVEKRRRIPIYTYSRDPRKACAVTERTSAHALRDAP